MQTLSIELIDRADKLHVKTQNGKSTYNYDSFIHLDDGTLGIDYIYGSRFIDIFQNGNIFLGNIKKGNELKYYCKNMVLDIRKVESSNINKIKESSKFPVEKKQPVIQTFPLKINRIPLNSRVRILNIKPKYYDGIKLKKGKYHIEVSKKGYKTIDKWVDLRKNKSFTIKLEKFQIDIPKESKLNIDNHNIHKTSNFKSTYNGKPNMSYLPKETKKIIENACTTEKYTGGASKYYSCIQTQLNQLGNKKKPNMSYLSKETKKIIENACKYLTKINHQK